MIFEYLRGNAKRIGLGRDFGSYDFNIQIMSPMADKDTEDLGVAFFVAILSATVGKISHRASSFWAKCPSMESWGG
jgi:ATP-dependent Lon protease